jgi:hypothetical protein
MNCTPVSDLGDIQRAYPLLAEACLRVGQREGESYFAPEIYAAVTAGQWVLFVVRDKGEMLGLVICRCQVEPGDGAKSLFVLVAYVVPGSPPDALAAGFKACKLYAKQCGAKTIQFVSKRAGWARRAQQLGYKPSRQVYELEV